MRISAPIRVCLYAYWLIELCVVLSGYIVPGYQRVVVNHVFER